MRDFEMPGRSAVWAANGMAATSHPLGAVAALDILKAGGNAADAAMAGALVLGIAEPQMTGIGGDCFVLVKPAGSEAVRALNGSGRAPMGLSAADLRARGLASVPIQGIEAVTMPGAIDAFCRLNATMGRLPLAQVLAPAIRAADEGVPVAPRVARDWARDAPALKGAARAFYLVGGQVPRVGQLFRAPGQAQVLRRVAAQGRDGFYAGEVAQDMIDSLRALGGTHRLDDLAAVEATWGDPVSATYKGAEVQEHPPNGQGATALLMLNILSHFDLASMDPLGADRAHVEAEAAKLAHDARNRFIADPGHTTRLAHMLAPETARRLAGLIDMGAAMPVPPPAAGAIHRDTIYITVVDRDRMAVSLIYSVYWGFGSGFASTKFGINFQNRGAGFTLQEGHPNEAGGGKRPMHTIIPGMARRGGRVTMPFGVMGGAYQPTGHARLVTNLVDYGMDLQTAIDAPRLFADATGMQAERGYPAGVVAELAARGHAVRPADGPLGGAQAIVLHDSGMLEGASDPRKDGCALGY